MTYPNYYIDRTPFLRIPADTILYNINRLDTFFLSYYELAILTDSADKVFTDTTAWDTTAQRRLYVRDVASNKLNNITLFEDILVAGDGSRFAYSYIDSASRWGILRDLALNLDDGDEITVIQPFRNHLKVFKNKSQFIVNPTGNFFSPFVQDWVVDGIGCIAPQSMVSFNNGLIYLSQLGVIFETGLVYKDNGSNYGFISEAINDILLDHTPAILREAVGVVVQKHQEYRLSFPSLDTTFVYNYQTGGWSINDYAFTQATFYDTSRTANIEPPSDFLFITNSSDKIFKGDTLTTDNGRSIVSRYKSGPIGIDYTYKQVEQIGLFFGANSVDSSYTVQIFDARDSADVDSTQITPSDIYDMWGMSPHESNYFYFQIDNIVREIAGGTIDTIPTMQINGIDLWLKSASAVEGK